MANQLKRVGLLTYGPSEIDRLISRLEYSPHRTVIDKMRQNIYKVYIDKMCIHRGLQDYDKLVVCIEIQIVIKFSRICLWEVLFRTLESPARLLRYACYG